MGKVDYDMNRQFLNDDFREKLLNYYVSEGMPRDVMMRQTTHNQGAKYMSRCDFKAHEVEDGEIIWLDPLKLQCIATPGHTSGHMMLYIPEAEILFTGDHVLFDITPNITVWEEAPDGQKWFAMGETVAHLDYLMFQGKVVKTKVDGVSRYRLV